MTFSTKFHIPLISCSWLISKNSSGSKTSLLPIVSEVISSICVCLKSTPTKPLPFLSRFPLFLFSFNLLGQIDGYLHSAEVVWHQSRIIYVLLWLKFFTHWGPDHRGSHQNFLRTFSGSISGCNSSGNLHYVIWNSLTFLWASVNLSYFNKSGDLCHLLT